VYPTSTPLPPPAKAHRLRKVRVQDLLLGYVYRAADRQVTRYQHQACADAQVELDRLSAERAQADQLATIEAMTENAIAAYPDRAEELRAALVEAKATLTERYTKESK